MDADALALRLRSVRQELDAAARGAGRDPGDVHLVVVTKAAPPAVFGALARLGVADVGESRVQAAVARRTGFETTFRWHLVGHLQSNKARRAVGGFDVFHGIDSADLARRLDRLAADAGRRLELFLQVNASGEASKSGLAPDELPAALEAVSGLEHARVTGLMTMAPRVDDPEEARPVFAALASLRDEHEASGRLPRLEHLSMGMTDDFAVAVAEGATWVRIGRRLVAPEAMG